MHEKLIAYISQYANLVLTSEEQALITATFQPKKLRKKQYFLQEGDVCKYAGFIVKGAMRQYSVDDKGTEHIVHLYIENYWANDRESSTMLTPSKYNIDAWEDTELLINITTPHAKMAIVRRGLYRVNVVPGDVTEVIVRKGRLLLSDPDAKIKAGKKLIFSGNSYSVAELTDAEKKEMDSLDLWSKDRSQVVAKANEALTSRDRRLLRSGFSSGFASDWAFRFSPRIGGIWFLDAACGFYSFMPFYAGWGSLYGRSYPFSFYSGYWWQVRNSYWPTQRGYFPDIGTGGSTGIGGKSIPVFSPGAGSTGRGSFPKGSGGGKQLP